jgi:uncharacterized integral membrane protein (TIGR00697 family)
MNEIWFFVIAITDLLLVLFAWRLGKEWVVVSIATNFILSTIFAAKLIPLFGVQTDAANVFYAAIFIGTDILTEHCGKKEGYKSVWIGFAAVLSFVVLSQLALRLSTIDETREIADAMQTLFAAVPRIAFASLTAYLVAQRFDIWLYHWIHEKTGDGKLWLRNCGSTFVSQFLDSVIFFTLAFLGSVPLSVLINIVLAGYGVKIVVGVLDTPCIYLSYWIKGLPLPGSVALKPEA